MHTGPAQIPTCGTRHSVVGWHMAARDMATAELALGWDVIMCRFVCCGALNMLQQVKLQYVIQQLMLVTTSFFQEMLGQACCTATTSPDTGTKLPGWPKVHE